MKRTQKTAIALVVIVVVALFTWGSMAGAGEVMGVITKSGSAAIEAEAQVGATDSVVIDRVVAPTPAFVVIHTEGPDGEAGKRIGFTSIPAGESREVRVKLKKGVPLTKNLLASIHIDRGKPGEFEYNMKNPDPWPDKPFFMDGMDVVTKVKIAEGGSTGDMGSEKDEPAKGDMDEAEGAKKLARGDAAKTEVDEKMTDSDTAKGEVAIEADPQPVRGASVTIAVVMAPADAWVVVHEDDNGSLGRRVGVTKVRAGENRNVVVQIDPTVAYSGTLFAVVHADTDTAGLFQFDKDTTATADPPYKENGKIVVAPITLR